LWHSGWGRESLGIIAQTIDGKKTLREKGSSPTALEEAMKK
jgi:hypothetical protein